MLIIAHKCSWCGTEEERLFTDSWTGRELCLECLSIVAQHVTNSPATEGDNLLQALGERVAERSAWPV